MTRAPQTIRVLPGGALPVLYALRESRRDWVPEWDVIAQFPTRDVAEVRDVLFELERLYLIACDSAHVSRYRIRGEGLAILARADAERRRRENINPRG